VVLVVVALATAMAELVKQLRLGHVVRQPPESLLHKLVKIKGICTKTVVVVALVVLVVLVALDSMATAAKGMLMARPVLWV
jgi:3-methyladenine DNA glycosylase/8-oxoguanine DNA glycosylase